MRFENKKFAAAADAAMLPEVEGSNQAFCKELERTAHGIVGGKTSYPIALAMFQPGTMVTNPNQWQTSVALGRILGEQHPWKWRTPYSQFWTI